MKRFIYSEFLPRQTKDNSWKTKTAEASLFFRHVQSGWGNATLVITHAESKMSCYNPLQLPMYDDDEGGRIYITCTFVNSFSGVVHKQQKCERLSLATLT